MTGNEKLQLFVAEIKAVCERHRLGIVGTCEGEGIYGEITIFDLDNPAACGWVDVLEAAYNFDFDTRYLKSGVAKE